MTNKVGVVSHTSVDDFVGLSKILESFQNL